MLGYKSRDKEVEGLKQEIESDNQELKKAHEVVQLRDQEIESLKCCGNCENSLNGEAYVDRLECLNCLRGYVSDNEEPVDNWEKERIK